MEETKNKDLSNLMKVLEIDFVEDENGYKIATSKDDIIYKIVTAPEEITSIWGKTPQWKQLTDAFIVPFRTKADKFYK